MISSDLLCQFHGQTHVATWGHCQQATLGLFRKIQVLNKLRKSFLIDALTSSQSLELLVGLRQAIAAHYGLHGFSQYFPTCVDISVNCLRVELKFSKASQAGVIGHDAIPKPYAKITPYGGIRQVTLET